MNLLVSMDEMTIDLYLPYMQDNRVRNVNPLT